MAKKRYTVVKRLVPFDESRKDEVVVSRFRTYRQAMEAASRVDLGYFPRVERPGGADTKGGK